MADILQFPGHASAPAGEAATPRMSEALDSVRERAQRLAEQGRLDDALSLLESAREQAESAGDREQIARTRVAWAALAVECGHHAAVRELLRSVVENPPTPTDGMLAAYQVGRSFELDRDYKKALYYARLAGERALGQTPKHQAAAWNLLGNVLLADSRETEAVRAYESALALMPEGELVRANVLDNVGYCRVLQGRCDEAFPLLQSALRTQLRARAWRYSISTRLDLCYAHLEVGRLRHARWHGERALELARRAEDPSSIQNALYLLGQIAVERGEAGEALELYRELEERFFPGTSLAPRLVAVDTRQLVTLRA